MPQRYQHRKLTKLLLGDDYDEVHAAIDRPVKKYPGRAHRRYNHDPLSAVLVGCKAAKKKGKSCTGGASAGLIHIIQDYPILFFVIIAFIFLLLAR